MGKTSGYHPVSLHVIRGALAYSGFRAGKIKKIAVFPEKEKAVYSVMIDAGPARSDDWPPKVWRRQLQHCFMDDIIVTTVRLSTDGTVIMVITVQLHRSPMDALDEGLDGFNEE